jgi:hypothetical protein
VCYLATAVSVAQPFLHVANRPQQHEARKIIQIKSSYLEIMQPKYVRLLFIREQIAESSVQADNT